MARNESEAFETASLILYNSLECCGISKRVADISRQLCHTYMNTVAQHTKCYDPLNDIIIKISGSSSDGLSQVNAILDTKGDIDLVTIPQHCFAFETDSLVSLHNDIHQLQIHHNAKRPGYVALELKHEGFPWYFPKNLGNISQIFLPVHDSLYLSSSLVNDLVLTLRGVCNTEKLTEAFAQQTPINCNFMDTHIVGPSVAMNIEGKGKHYLLDKIDNVLAIKCPQWPSVANEWISRNRNYNWPPSSFISEHIKHGAEVVPVGCRASSDGEKSLEWRLSFSETESGLVILFNETQLKCYACLKILMKRWIKPHTEVLTSYTVKTAMFWLIEETPNTLWIPLNLFKCILMCLNRIVQWIIDGYCPHFFVRGRNMFLGQNDSTERSKLVAHILDLMRNLWKNLTSIDCLFAIANRSPNYMAYAANLVCSRVHAVVNIYNRHVTSNYLVHVFMDSVAQNEDLGAVLRLFENRLGYTRSLENTSDTSFDVNMSFQYQILFKHQILALLEKLLNHPDSKRCQNITQAVRKVGFLSKQFGGVSGRVMTAQMFVFQENYPGAVSVLKVLLSEETLQSYVRLKNIIGIWHDPEMSSITADEEQRMTRGTAISDGVVDICFLQVELPWLPQPIQMELCANLPHKTMLSNMDIERVRRFTVRMDPLVYGCYLKFHCSRRLDIKITQLEDIRRLERCCAIQSIPYKDVAYNLLGYCYFSVSDDEMAYRQFIKALRENRTNEATLWHIAKLIYKRLWSEWSSVT